MWLSQWPSFENNQWIPSEEKIIQWAKQNTNEVREGIEEDQRVILNLTYLTTLSRLPENRDLDELFDGEVQLWEEELLAVYWLLDVINWNHTIKRLKTPKKINTDWNWAQDYENEFNYEKVEEGNRIKSISWDWTLPLNDTKLIFDYWNNNDINKLTFERPTNIDLEWGWMGLDQEIKLKRENWLVTELQILRDFEIDNKLSIRYNSINKPELIEQTKLWMISDKILFEYDNNWNLKTIFYLPGLSLKHLKWWNKIGQKYHKWTTMKWVKNLWEVLINWVYTTFQSIKMLDSCDIININNENWLPISTKTTLNSSRWLYENWFSNSKYNKDWELQELYLEKEEIWPDDKKNITLEY